MNQTKCQRISIISLMPDSRAYLNTKGAENKTLKSLYNQINGNDGILQHTYIYTMCTYVFKKSTDVIPSWQIFQINNVGVHLLFLFIIL